MFIKTGTAVAFMTKISPTGADTDINHPETVITQTLRFADGSRLVIRVEVRFPLHTLNYG